MQKSIPTLDPIAQQRHHFDNDRGWSPYLASGHLHFHINRVEDVMGMLQFPLPPHRKTHHDFIFLTAGSSKRGKNLSEYVFSANTFFFLPALQITTHEYFSPDAKGYFCQFEGDLLNSTYITRNRVGDFPFLQSAGNPIVRVRPEANAIVVPILERLLLEYHLHQPDKLDLCRLYLLTLFTELKRFVAPPEATSVHAAIRLTEQYKNKLARHIYEKQKVSEYADLLTVTPNHLNKCAKVATGKTAQTLLNEMLLLEAKVLLKETDLNINEIACKISGQDPSNFGRFFKTKTGVTPVAYRQQM